MKRPLLLLALPLVLAALMFGVKWRADHPTPTKEDLKFRALLSELSLVDMDHWSSQLSSATKSKTFQLKRAEVESFIESFNLSSVMPVKGGSKNGNDWFMFQFRAAKLRRGRINDVNVWIDVTHLEGQMGMCCNSQDGGRIVHPATTKRWIELLLANPRIGPELRKRLNP